MHEQKQRWSVPAARDLRGRETPSEELLWQALRDRRMAGCKFRRQHPISKFVVDFYCMERRLVVEVDGEIHDQQQDYDAERDAILAGLGLRVLRFPNAEVQREFHHVLATIRAALHAPLTELPGAAEH